MKIFELIVSFELVSIMEEGPVTFRDIECSELKVNGTRMES